MKKIFLTVISVLIMILSSVLIYHVATNAPVDDNQTIVEGDSTLSDISNEIDDLLIGENDEIDIGEMI